MASYYGHKNWNHWNVSLWLNNTEALYFAMQSCRRNWRTKDKAAREFLRILRDTGHDRTPDGAPYSVSSIRAAMVD